MPTLGIRIPCHWLLKYNEINQYAYNDSFPIILLYTLNHKIYLQTSKLPSVYIIMIMTHIYTHKYQHNSVKHTLVTYAIHKDCANTFINMSMSDSIKYYTWTHRWHSCEISPDKQTLTFKSAWQRVNNSCLPDVHRCSNLHCLT